MSKMFVHIRETLGIQASVSVCVMTLKYLPHYQWKGTQKERSRMSATTGKLVNFKEKLSARNSLL